MTELFIFILYRYLNSHFSIMFVLSKTFFVVFFMAVMFVFSTNGASILSKFKTYGVYCLLVISQ